VDVAVTVRRRRHDDGVDARDARRDDGHDERGRVGGEATGHVRADARERAPAALDLHAREGSSCAWRRGRCVSANRRTFSIACSRARSGRGRARRAPRAARGPSSRRRPSGRPPPKRPAFVSRTAAPPRARTSARISRARSRTAGSGTAPRRNRPSRAAAQRPGRPANGQVESAKHEGNAGVRWSSRDDLLDRQDEDAGRTGRLEARQQAPDLVASRRRSGWRPCRCARAG
jgi:hypothetical protein